ncbi:MAG: 4-hydroxy-tetrahydrodipicolinate reductase [Saprospiraceae bacterium]
MKISLIGYGKMGKEIETLCLNRGHTIYSIVDPLLNTTLDDLSGADMVIEFTQPAAAYHNIAFCLDHHIPIVSGTTGWHDELPILKEKCLLKGGSFFYSSNFSIGVNVFWKVSEYLAKMMDQYRDYELGLLEIHHIHKKDAPSGTAVTLANKILNRSPKYTAWHLAEMSEFKLDGSIPIKSERQGEVPGTHKVEYKSGHDRIELTHEAFSRKGFVTGVVAAAEWLLGKKGVYGMEDMLG